jgi:hypothetical protein
MTFRVARALVVCAAGLAAAGTLPVLDRSARANQEAVEPGSRAGVTVANGLDAAVRQTSIVGAAWHSDNRPIPFAKLRLRSVVSGRIQSHTISNEAGEFVFHKVDTGSYLIELVSDSGSILAVGHTFTVAPGETVATFVRLGSKAPWFNGFFSNAAAAVASSAAAAGITAVAPEQIRPVSARR